MIVWQRMGDLLQELLPPVDRSSNDDPSGWSQAGFELLKSSSEFVAGGDRFFLRFFQKKIAFFSKQIKP